MAPYETTVDGDTRPWFSFEYALTDALSRGFGKAWKIEKIVPEDPKGD